MQREISKGEFRKLMEIKLNKALPITATYEEVVAVRRLAAVMVEW